MTNHEATEQAYKKGYEDGFKEGYDGGFDVGKRHAMDWIPVTERLPDLELAEAKANDADFYPCLVVIKHPKAKGGRYVSKCWYNGYDFLDTDECPWTYETTHWMHLPEPPKGE